AERLKCVHGSAIASPSDHREMIPVAGPGEEGAGPIARGADDKNRIARSELIGVITAELDSLIDDVRRPLRKMGYGGRRGGAGRGGEGGGVAGEGEAGLGKPVRIGKPPHLKGLPEAHAVPGFSTLAGLVLYAAADPIDIRRIGSSFQSTTRPVGLGLVFRVFR